MRILIHSSSADSGGLAYLMQKEGAQVDFYVKDPSYRRGMEGIVPHVETMDEGLRNKPDVVLFDLNGDGDEAERIRRMGFKVVGGSQIADRLEMDRNYGTSVAKQYGLKVPKTTEFKDLSQAIAFVKKEKKALAIKIDNNKSESSSYVAKDAEEMVDYLSYSDRKSVV